MDSVAVVLLKASPMYEHPVGLSFNPAPIADVPYLTHVKVLVPSTPFIPFVPAIKLHA